MKFVIYLLASSGLIQYGTKISFAIATRDQELKFGLGCQEIVKLIASRLCHSSMFLASLSVLICMDKVVDRKEENNNTYIHNNTRVSN